ncbi:MAG TPA: preprotein translocase subunit SecE [Capillimicrobium sp.]|nr:preprotein translocase subunit SecE [Capillimicrobium sp.]
MASSPDPDRERDDALPEDDPLRRENVPGELQHASGEVDEVEAAIVAGSEGRTYDDDAELAREAGAAARRPARGRAEAEVAPRQDGNRVLNFLAASWAELQRVQWPDRRQVGQATAVVIGFVVIAGAYLGVADWVAQRVVDFII